MTQNKLQQVIQFASLAHKGQLRKQTNIPYISHLFEVAIILTQNGADDDTLYAGILHDCVEDTNVTIDQIKQQFGQTVANIVAAESEDKSKSWEERKANTLTHLQHASLQAKMVACADKLSNIRSILAEKQTVGNNVWNKFNRGYDKQKWYYTGIVTALADLQEYDMYQELKQLVQLLFDTTK